MSRGHDRREPNSVILAYMSLAAAIVESGSKEHDTRFLESDWCSFLTESVKDFAESRIHKSAYINQHTKKGQE